MQDLRCVYNNENTCKVTWKNEFCDYTVLMKEGNTKSERLAVKIKQSSLKVDNMKSNASYYFTVISETMIGKDESNIQYIHS